MVDFLMDNPPFCFSNEQLRLAFVTLQYLFNEW